MVFESNLLLNWYLHRVEVTFLTVFERKTGAWRYSSASVKNGRRGLHWSYVSMPRWHEYNMRVICTYLEWCVWYCMWNENCIKLCSHDMQIWYMDVLCHHTPWHVLDPLVHSHGNQTKHILHVQQEQHLQIVHFLLLCSLTGAIWYCMPLLDDIDGLSR